MICFVIFLIDFGSFFVDGDEWPNCEWVRGAVYERLTK